MTAAEIIRGNWTDPDAGRVLVGEYAESWVSERPNLRPETIQLHKGLVRLHLAPTFGTIAVQDITEPQVRRRRRNLLDSGGWPGHGRNVIPAAQSHHDDGR
ncbi:MAG TPA: hypothetical protein VKV80_00350 [Streptosporangiaceae bacterium]|nr:hypothetical protein [Streptosporangiaceae bacterium]